MKAAEKLKDFYIVLQHLNPVGPDKPLGYICEGGLADDERWNPVCLQFFFQAKGLQTRMLHRVNSVHGNTDMLVVFHEKSLRELLESRKGVLRNYGWSTDPDEFIQRISEKTAPPKTELFDLIADAFADYGNWWRTDCDVPADVLKGNLDRAFNEPWEYFWGCPR